MKISVREFLGMRPSQDADALNPGEAVLSNNARLDSGGLDPFHGPSAAPIVALSGAGQVKSVYRYGQDTTNEALYWFQHTGDMDVVRGPVNTNTEERTYITGRAAYPEKTRASMLYSPYPGGTLRMGVPAPAAMAAPTVSGTPTLATDPTETVVYATTYVSSWGEEGPPSVASAQATWQPGQTVNLTGLPVAPTGAYDIASKNLYRSATGTSGTQYQFVANIAIAATTYADSAATSSLGGTLPTNGWIEPLDTMVGLTAMPNGVMAGFSGNTLCFCEPNAPYAWPAGYRRPMDAPIVGIAAFDQSLFVGTKTGIYMLTGTDPASMTLDKLPGAQSCVSKRSVVAMQGGVLFASPDGLFKLSGAGIGNVSDGVLRRADWQAYKPDSISAYESDNRYIAFYDTGSAQGAMVFTFGSRPSFSLADNVYAYAGFRDKARDALYLVDSLNHVVKWDDATAALVGYTWRSGVFHLSTETNMACARVDADSYPLTFKLYADDVLKATITVADKFGFRLPSGYRSRRYAFELAHNATIRSVDIADSMAELFS